MSVISGGEIFVRRLDGATVAYDHVVALRHVEQALCPFPQPHLAASKTFRHGGCMVLVVVRLHPAPPAPAMLVNDPPMLFDGDGVGFTGICIGEPQHGLKPWGYQPTVGPSQRGLSGGAIR